VTTRPGLPYISVSLISVNRKVTAHSHHSISAAIKPVSAPITDGSWTPKFALLSSLTLRHEVLKVSRHASPLTNHIAR